MFYARYVELCANKNVSPSKVALECSFNKGSVSVWKKKYEKGEDVKPTPEILVKIAEYFNVSVGYLLGVEDNSVIEAECPVCGCKYNANSESDVIKHDDEHIGFLTAQKFFGKFNVINKQTCEKVKEDAWAIINNANKYPDGQTELAVIDLYRAWFSQNLCFNDYSLAHPKFDDYVAMLLYQPHQKEVVLSKLSEYTQKRLLSTYGEKPGIENGKTKFELSEETKKAVIIDFPTVTDDDIKFALFDGDKDITDEMYNEVKEFAKYVKSKYKKE